MKEEVVIGLNQKQDLKMKIYLRKQQQKFGIGQEKVNPLDGLRMEKLVTVNAFDISKTKLTLWSQIQKIEPFRLCQATTNTSNHFEILRFT